MPISISKILFVVFLELLSQLVLAGEWDADGPRITFQCGRGAPLINFDLPVNVSVATDDKGFASDPVAFYINQPARYTGIVLDPTRGAVCRAIIAAPYIFSPKLQAYQVLSWEHERPKPFRPFNDAVSITANFDSKILTWYINYSFLSKASMSLNFSGSYIKIAEDI